MKIILTLLFLLPFWAQAGGGDSMGNGGNLIAGDFTALARLTVHDLSALSLSADLQNALKAIEPNLDLVKVNVEDSLKLAGAEVDAINYPDQKLILVSQNRWNQNPNHQSRGTQRLVLHEYLGVSGLNDSTYAISTALILQLQKASLAQFGAVKKSLEDLDATLKEAIQRLQKDTQAHGASVAKKSFCDRLEDFDKTLDMAYEALKANQTRLEANGMLDIAQNIALFKKTHEDAGLKCFLVTTEPPEKFPNFLLQFEVFVSSFLNSF